MEQLSSCPVSKSVSGVFTYSVSQKLTDPFSGKKLGHKETLSN